MFRGASNSGSASQKERNRWDWGRHRDLIHYPPSRFSSVGVLFMKAFPSIPNCICSLTTHCPMCVPLSLSFTHDDQCYQSLHIDQPTSLLELLSECWIDCWSSTLPFYCNRTSNFSWVHCPAAKRPHFSVFHAYMRDP